MEQQSCIFSLSRDVRSNCDNDNDAYKEGKGLSQKNCWLRDRSSFFGNTIVMRV